MKNDLSDTLTLLGVSFWSFFIIPYQNLKSKSVGFAILIYAIIHFLFKYLFILSDSPYYLIAMIIEMVVCGLLILFYNLRSYKSEYIDPEPNRIYCLRHNPSSFQGFLISSVGIFGPNGEYAIYCNDYVYRFHHGKLIKIPYKKEHYKDWIFIKGSRFSYGTRLTLDNMVGTKWKLFGPNCITLLQRFWKTHYK